METIYLCVHRIRSKKLEKLNIEDVCIYDNTEVEFMSHDYSKVKEYFENIKKVDNEYWKSIAKYVVCAPINTNIQEGIINEELIHHYSFEKEKQYK